MKIFDINAFKVKIVMKYYFNLVHTEYIYKMRFRFSKLYINDKHDISEVYFDSIIDFKSLLED